MSGVYNIKKNPIEQGATFKRTLTLGGIDITGWTFTWCLKNDLNGADVIELSSETGGITITDGPNGQFEILLTDEQTGAITWTDGKHEIFAALPDGSKRRLLHGTVKVELRVC